MKVWFTIPYSIEKNLGKAYNQEMERIPDGDAACFLDGDTLFLTHDFGEIITSYANAYPDAVLTCWTNRIHEKAIEQKKDFKSTDIKDHLKIKQGFTTVTPLQGSVSGFLLVVPKSVWLKHKFTETNIYRPGTPNLLGVDNEFTNKIRSAGIPVLRMDGVYIWHSYRLLSDGMDKSHLL